MNPGVPNFRATTGIAGQKPEEENGGEWGIRTPEGLHPTRFPSVRHRPLGEFSWVASALRATAHNILPDAGGCPVHARLSAVRYTGCRLLTWRHPGQLPQGGDAARVTGLWRVREGSFSMPAPRQPVGAAA